MQAVVLTLVMHNITEIIGNILKFFLNDAPNHFVGQLKRCPLTLTKRACRQRISQHPSHLRDYLPGFLTGILQIVRQYSHGSFLRVWSLNNPLDEETALQIHTASTQLHFKLPAPGGIPTLPITAWNTAHPIARLVTAVGAYRGRSINGPSSASVVATFNGKSVGVAAQVGQGRVFVFADEWVTYNGQWDDTSLSQPAANYGDP